MLKYCEGCTWDRKYSWHQKDMGPSTHSALVIAGSLSNAQRRTIGFETSRAFSYHPENACDIDINIGSKALLSFLYDEDRPMLALDIWKGRKDTARSKIQMTTHEYNFNVLAIDEKTDKEIESRGVEKLYGVPIYIIKKGMIALREYDPDGSEVLFEIPRIS